MMMLNKEAVIAENAMLEIPLTLMSFKASAIMLFPELDWLQVFTRLFHSVQIDKENVYFHELECNDAGLQRLMNEIKPLLTLELGNIRIAIPNLILITLDFRDIYGDVSLWDVSQLDTTSAAGFFN